MTIALIRGKIQGSKCNLLSRTIMATRKKSAKEVVDENRIGRPPLSPEGSVTMNIRLTPDQREKLRLLGGVAWIRDVIDSARVPSRSRAAA